MEKVKEWYEDETFGAFWEKGYRDKSVSTMGGPSVEIYEILPFLPKGARVLDLGCGEGRNSIYLAQNGCKVTCIDHSEHAVEKIKIASKDLGLDVDARVGDLSKIETLGINGKYDLIMAHGVLYYLTNKQWKSLLNVLKESTVDGGFNIYTLFIFSDEYPALDEIVSAGYKFSFEPEELKEFYQDWNIFRYDMYVKWDKHPNIPVHVHPIEKLIACKGKDVPKYTLKSLYVEDSSLTRERFDEVEIGINEKDLIEDIGKPILIDEIDFKGNMVGCNDYIESKYVLRDLFYGNYGFQFINDELRGKYIYNTEPSRLVKEGA